jgi:hypothetical protein
MCNWLLDGPLLGSSWLLVINLFLFVILEVFGVLFVEVALDLRGEAQTTG